MGFLGEIVVLYIDFGDQKRAGGILLGCSGVHGGPWGISWRSLQVPRDPGAILGGPWWSAECPFGDPWVSLGWSLGVLGGPWGHPRGHKKRRLFSEVSWDSPGRPYGTHSMCVFGGIGRSLVQS